MKDIMGMMGKVKEMQAKMEGMQAELEDMTTDGVAGGGVAAEDADDGGPSRAS